LELGLPLLAPALSTPKSRGLPRRSLRLLVADVLTGQVDFCDNLVEAQLVGQALVTGHSMANAEAGQNVQKQKAHTVDQRTIFEALPPEQMETEQGNS